ncbi:MAG: hypothetical protein KF744_08100 [Taibaiella sp.]|nr:hypothetical protein [Taibaiella sp.]
MKKFIGPILLASLAVVNIVGCKKDENKTTSARYVNATASNGTSVSFSESAAGTTKNNASPHPYIEVNGYIASYSTSPRTGFWIYSYTSTPGTYSIDGVNIGAYYNRTSVVAADTIHNSAYGTLVISSVTPNLTGTISFTCRDSVAVTGSFSVPAP